VAAAVAVADSVVAAAVAVTVDVPVVAVVAAAGAGAKTERRKFKISQGTWGCPFALRASSSLVVELHLRWPPICNTRETFLVPCCEPLARASLFEIET
ncbi:MAG: hypothetical protein WBS19_05370, partial [Candidatus Korobacteraceae bacterium]